MTRPSLPRFIPPVRPLRRAARAQTRRFRPACEAVEARTLLSTFTVTSAADNGDNVHPVAGSLRQAILAVNNDPGTDRDVINFAITGTGLQTIQPTSPLPDVTHAVLIDGYTQPGSSPNTSAVGDNAVLNVELDGEKIARDDTTNGLRLDGLVNSTVRGLVVNRFPANGIYFYSGSRNAIEGNFLGTDSTGMHALGNGSTATHYGGALLLYSPSSRIGTDGDGTSDIPGGLDDRAERNLISGNGGFGVMLYSDNSVLAGNLIGTDATGAAPLGNGYGGVDLALAAGGDRVGSNGTHPGAAFEGNVIAANLGGGLTIGTSNNLVAGNFIGTDQTGTVRMGQGDGVFISTGSDNQIGGSPALANTIAYNNRGVELVQTTPGTCLRNVFRANSIYANPFFFDDANGQPLRPALNDPGDADTGPNNLQNFPVLATVQGGANTRVTGSLNSTPGTKFTLDFYATTNNTYADPTGYGGGQRYLGSTDVTTDANGDATFDTPLTAGTAPGDTVSAMANGPDGTSEFAKNVVVAQSATVTTLTSSGASLLSGQPVTFTATVNPGTATGSVDFYDGANKVGSGTLSGGVATWGTATLAAGTHGITAVYPGDANDLTSTSGVVSTAVIPPASLSGVVFSDFNDDGQVDFGERGIAGIPVTLTGTDDLGHAVSLSQTTDNAGAYVFLNLRPGAYTITETQQPAGYTPGIASVGTGGGSVSGAQFTVSLPAGVNAMNYNYGERPVASGQVHEGQTAGIGFWNNKHGQDLIKALNGGVGTQLGDWLAATFPHLFGASSGGNNLAGKNNAYVASFFQGRFVVHGQKLDAQVLATALAVYVTNATLDNTGVGSQYGFTVCGNGVGTAAYNVGDSGAAFGVADHTTMTVMDLLLAADAQAVNGVLYSGDTARRNKANDVFSDLNEAGDD